MRHTFATSTTTHVRMLLPFQRPALSSRLVALLLLLLLLLLLVLHPVIAVIVIHHILLLLLLLLAEVGVHGIFTGSFGIPEFEIGLHLLSVTKPILKRHVFTFQLRVL